MLPKIDVFEVITRDGFQIEPEFIPTEQKVQLINELSRTGVKKIEVSSFVSPKWVPQLRDAEEVFKRIERNNDVTYTALVPNIKGVERAIQAQVDEINLVMSVSETHNKANIGRTTEQSLQGFKEIMANIQHTNIKVNGSLATSFGCPFEGELKTDRVLSLLENYLASGMDSITFADTTGMAHPRQVKELMSIVVEKYPTVPITLHFHNTRGMGLANVIAGMEAGVHQYDAALGGLGGCPFAPGATGNICTEDLVHMLHAMGYETGIDLDKLIYLSNELANNIVKREVPGQVVKSGKITDLHELE